MFFSAINFRASNIDAVGTMVYTAASDFDRRIGCCSGCENGTRRDRLSAQPPSSLSVGIRGAGRIRRR